MTLAALRSNVDGASAVEFAMVAAMFIPLVFFILIVALIFFIGQSLDFATQKAARQVMIGAAQKAGTSQAAFQASICANLPVIVSCNDVIVNVQTITEAPNPQGYYPLLNSAQTGLALPPMNNAASQYSLGSQQSYEYIQVVYPFTLLPAFMANMFGGGLTYNGSPAYPIIATAAFRNEQY